MTHQESERVGVVISDQLSDRLENAIDTTGLNKSEILRSGLDRELRRLNK
jgi:metal-responsive CopG/Arc/MetJ family transcriptional regulator